MRCHRSLVPVLAVTVLAGCVQAKKIEVWATLVDDNGTRRVEIDRHRHDSAVVQPGDRVAWVCHCPPGTEFTVEGLHYVGDLEELAEKLSSTEPVAKEELQSLIPAMERVQARLAAQAAGAPVDTSREEAAKPLGEGRIRFAGPVGDVLLVVKDAAPPAPGERSLFAGASFPPAADFVAATRAIRSGRVAPGLGHELWKFTWKVQLIGDPGSVDTWDPHIFGHPDLKDK